MSWHRPYNGGCRGRLAVRACVRAALTVPGFKLLLVATTFQDPGFGPI